MWFTPHPNPVSSLATSETELPGKSVSSHQRRRSDPAAAAR